MPVGPYDDKVRMVIPTAPNGTLNAKPLGFQQVTSTASAFSLTVPQGASYCLIQADTQNLRWRDDGVAPTATVGMTITTSEELVYDGNLAAIQLIAATAGAIANISYYA